MVVEDHCFTVLTAYIENGFAVRVVMSGTGNVSGHFADTEVIGNEISCILNDLASGHNCTGDVLQSGDSGILKKLIDSLPQLTEVTGTAF